VSRLPFLRCLITRVRLVEVEQSEDDPKKKEYSFQYKSRKIIRSSTNEHTFLQVGHLLPCYPAPFFAISQLITRVPVLIETAVRRQINQFFPDDALDINLVNDSFPHPLCLSLDLSLSLSLSLSLCVSLSLSLSLCVSLSLS
jgi:hypothetical protein